MTTDRNQNAPSAQRHSAAQPTHKPRGLWPMANDVLLTIIPMNWARVAIRRFLFWCTVGALLTMSQSWLHALIAPTHGKAQTAFGSVDVRSLHPAFMPIMSNKPTPHVPYPLNRINGSIDTYGWPTKSFTIIYAVDNSNPPRPALDIPIEGKGRAQSFGAALPYYHARAGIPLPWQRPDKYYNFQAALPIIPVTPGLYTNTAFYSFTAWLTITIARLIRAHHRLRRHRCPRCTYDLSATVFNTTTSAHLKTHRCPECNWQPRRRG